MSKEEPRLTMTVEEFAARFDVKPSHVYRCVREGLIPAIKFGRLYRIPAVLPDRLMAKAMEDSDAA